MDPVIATERRPTAHASREGTDDQRAASTDTNLVESAVHAVTQSVEAGPEATVSTISKFPIQFGLITANNVEMLRQLNVHIFPVRYNESFYGDVLFVPKGYAQFAYWDGFVVGAICCRHEPMDVLNRCPRQRTYIMTLGVLEPYRHYKIGSALLQMVIQRSTQDGIDHIYLHVQTNNDTALRFYRRFGFEIRDTIHNYYKRLYPPDCFVLVKSLKNQD